MMLNPSKRRRSVRFLLAVFLLSSGTVGCGHSDMNTVKLNGKLPRVYVRTVARGPSANIRGRRAIDRLPRKSVKQIAQNQARNG